MLRCGVWIVCVISSLSLGGCSTVEGMAFGIKKDADAVYHYMNKEDGWMKKTDNWMKEHLW
jgi:hypothetical protein